MTPALVLEVNGNGTNGSLSVNCIHSTRLDFSFVIAGLCIQNKEAHLHHQLHQIGALTWLQMQQCGVAWHTHNFCL